MNSFRMAWHDAAHGLGIASDEVHVWWMSLDVSPLMLDRLRCTLSLDELERAQRFHDARDRARFVAGRGQLREILAGYVDIAAERILFHYGPFGKPSLRSISGGDGLCFNLAHSEAVAVVAVAPGRAVGIDVERVDRSIAVGELARCFFSQREVEELHGLPAELQQQAFFHCWTCKEAYVKARGDGLSLPLARFHVRADPRLAALFYGNDLEPDEAKRWSFLTFAANSEYRAALVVEGQGWRIRFPRWATACEGIR